MKQSVKKISKDIKHSQEAAARKTLLEELFNDFNSNRNQVYKINFIRGLTFGLGSVLGGTVVIAVLIWLLTLLGGVIQPLGDFFDGLTALLKSSSK